MGNKKRNLKIRNKESTYNTLKQEFTLHSHFEKRILSEHENRIIVKHPDLFIQFNGLFILTFLLLFHTKILTYI